jgi:hypothetical protein
LRCEAVRIPETLHVQPILESAFDEFGLPRAIRSDNGPPLASTGLGGLTPLSVWWIKLGIVPERIQPGRPEAGTLLVPADVACPDKAVRLACASRGVGLPVTRSSASGRLVTRRAGAKRPDEAGAEAVRRRRRSPRPF